MNGINGEQHGRLSVVLDTRADRNYNTDVFYAYADALQGEGLYVNSLLPSHYNEYVSGIHVRAMDTRCSKVKIVSKYGNATLSLDGETTFKTGVIGLSYASCEIRITLLPDSEEERENRKMMLEKTDGLINDGWELIDEGFNDGAEDCAQEAIDLLSPAAATYPAAFKLVLSDAYYLKGWIYSLKDDEEDKMKAIQPYEQAEHLRKQLAKDAADKVALRKYAQVERALGLLYKEMNDYRMAEKYLTQATELYKRVDEIAPGEYREKYAATLAELANAQRMNEVNYISLETSRMGLKLCMLPHDESEDEDYLVDACMCQENLSLLYSEEKEYAEAIAAGENLMELLRLLCQKNNIYAGIIKEKEEWLSEQRLLLEDVNSVFKDEITGIDLGLPSGTVWANCNLGALNPKDAGNYYAWGTPHCNIIPENSKMPVDDDIAGTKFDPAYVSTDGVWLMPTQEQMRELCEECRWQWVEQGEPQGYYITGPNGESIFLPAAGKKDSNHNYEAGCFYWTSGKEEKEMDGPYDSTLYYDCGVALIADNKGYRVDSLLPDTFAYRASVRPVQAENVDDNPADDDGRYDAWA